MDDWADGFTFFDGSGEMGGNWWPGSVRKETSTGRVTARSRGSYSSAEKSAGLFDVQQSVRKFGYVRLNAAIGFEVEDEGKGGVRVREGKG